MRHLTLLAVGFCVGCGPIKMHREDLLGSDVVFTPDEPKGGVAQWLYEFHEGKVIGCNHEATYESTGWDIDEGANRVTVDFSGAWEEYVLDPHDDDLFTGDFTYQASAGPQYDMEGSWVRNSGLRPLACP